MHSYYREDMSKSSLVSALKPCAAASEQACRLSIVNRPEIPKFLNSAKLNGKISVVKDRPLKPVAISELSSFDDEPVPALLFFGLRVCPGGNVTTLFRYLVDNTLNQGV